MYTVWSIVDVFLCSPFVVGIIIGSVIVVFFAVIVGAILFTVLIAAVHYKLKQMRRS